MIGGLVVGRKWCRYWSSSMPSLPLWQPWLWAFCWWCCPSWDPPCTFDPTVSMRLWKTWKTDSPDHSDQFIPSNSVKRKNFVEVRKIRKPTFLLFLFHTFSSSTYAFLYVPQEVGSTWGTSVFVDLCGDFLFLAADSEHIPDECYHGLSGQVMHRSTRCSHSKPPFLDIVDQPGSFLVAKRSGYL